MKQEFHYTPDNLKIFPGYYESPLFSSDDEIRENESIRQNALANGEQPVDHELNDFEGFCNAVNKDITEREIKPLLMQENALCDNVEYEDMSSPAFYNYTTDKLNLKLNIDLELLKEKILSDKEMTNGFDKYLREKYSDRSGFWSFVVNNIKDYFEKMEYLDVMVDYYLLTFIYDNKDVVKAIEAEIDWTSYMWSLREIASEHLYEFMEPVKETE